MHPLDPLQLPLPTGLVLSNTLVAEAQQLHDTRVQKCEVERQEAVAKVGSWPVQRLLFFVNIVRFTPTDITTD